jgi:hypothetical protein
MESSRARRSVLVYGLATVAVMVIAWAHAFWFGHTWTFLQIIVPFSFVLLGMLIKYGDVSFDDGEFDQKVSKAIAVPCGLWMGALIITDPDSATIFIGLLLALLLASKYDNTAFRLGFAAAGIMAIISFKDFPNNANYIGVVVVFAAAFLDEKASDWADRRDGGSMLARLLKERPILKVAILLLCVTAALSSYLYFFAFLGFDLGYSFVERLSVLRRCQAVPV